MDEGSRQGSGWRSWFLRALFESALVIVSILAALAVNEWRDQRELAKQVQQARLAFAREIQANNATLLSTDSGLPNHERLLARYREVSTKPSITGEDMRAIYEEFPSGVNMLRLRDAVWRSLSGSDVLRRLEQGDLFLLAEIYRQQEEIDDFNRAMYAAWRQVNAEADSPGYVKDNLRTTRAYLADVIAAEKRLRALYEQALQRFRE